MVFFIESISENFSADLASLFGRLGVNQDDVTVDVVLGAGSLGADGTAEISLAVLSIHKLLQVLVEIATKVPEAS